MPLRHPSNGQIAKSLFAQGIAMGMGLNVGSAMEFYHGQDKWVCTGVWLCGVVVIAMSWLFRLVTEKYWPKDEAP